VIYWRKFIMATSFWNRLLKKISRPAPRDGRGLPRGAMRVRPGVEQLESRLVPAVTSKLVNGQLLVTGDNTGNTITLSHTGTNTLVNGKAFADAAITGGIVINSGTGNDTVNILTAVKAVTVNGQNGNDTVNVGQSGSVQGVKGNLSITNQLGFTTLDVDDHLDSGARNVTVGSTGTASSTTGFISGLVSGEQISFAFFDVNVLRIHGGSGQNTYTVTDTIGSIDPGEGTFLDTGTGNDAVNVQGTFGQLTITNQGGEDGVNVGLNHLVQSIRGELTVNPGGGVVALHVDDSADTFAKNVTVNTDHASNLLAQPLSYPGANNTNFNMTLMTGSGSDTFSVQSYAAILTIFSGGGNDTVNVGSPAETLDGLFGDFLFVSGDGTDTLNINDQGSTTPNSYTVDAFAVHRAGTLFIQFDSTLEKLNVNAGSGGNTIAVTGTGAAVSTTLNSGFGVDTVTVAATTNSPLTLNGQGGDDTVTLGQNGSVQAIHKAVTVTNAFDFTALTIDGGADVNPEVITLATTGSPNTVGATGTITGLAPGKITFNQIDVSTVTVNAGKGGNTITVANTFLNLHPGSGTFLNTGLGLDKVTVQRTSGPLTIDGQDGRDTVNVGLSGNAQQINGALSIFNGLSTTALTVNDQADLSEHAVTVDFGAIFNLTPAPIFYGTFDVNRLTLNGGKAGNIFNVLATPFGVPVTINAGGAGDIVDVGSVFNTLDAIQGPLTVNGQLGFDELFINDQGSTTAHTYTQTANSLQRSGAAKITFSGIENLQVNKGPVLGSPPLATGLALAGSARVGERMWLSGRLSDADAADRLYLTVDWGDGSAAVTTQPGRDPFVRGHRYAKAGSYAVRVIWTDSTGQSNFHELQLTVGPA
jgi:hypothetical protein